MELDVLEATFDGSEPRSHDGEFVAHTLSIEVSDEPGVLNQV